MFIHPCGPNLSEALNIHLLNSDYALRCVSGLKALLAYFVAQSEPKILRLVVTCFNQFKIVVKWLNVVKCLILMCLFAWQKKMVKVWTIEWAHHVKSDWSKGNFLYFPITAELSLMSLSEIFRFEFEIFLCQCFSPLRILIILNTMRFDSDSLMSEVSGLQVENDNWLPHITNSLSEIY